MHGKNADAWLSSLLDEAEDIVLLNSFKKERIVFHVSEPLFITALHAIPEILTEWEEDLQMASPHLKTQLAAHCPFLVGPLFLNDQDQRNQNTMSYVKRKDVKKRWNCCFLKQLPEKNAPNTCASL